MVAVVLNRSKDGARLLSRLSKSAGKEKLHVFGGFPLSASDRKKILTSKIILVLGGDGTVLSTFGQIPGIEAVPILPVHFGTLGFISSVTPAEAPKLLSDFLNNRNVHFDERCSLKVKLGKKTFRALNEAVFQRSDKGRLMRIESDFAGIRTLSFRADGLIVSTATGSTAYNLSAGGPIIHPNAQTMLFNPICPHSLTLKPLIIGSAETICVRTFLERDKGRACLVIDGVNRTKLRDGEEIEVTLSAEKLRLIKRSSEHYYTVLRKKLGWGA